MSNHSSEKSTSHHSEKGVIFYPAGAVREIRGVVLNTKLQDPQSQVIGKAAIAQLTFDINQCVSEFKTNERTQNPIVTIELAEADSAKVDENPQPMTSEKSEVESPIAVPPENLSAAPTKDPRNDSESCNGDSAVSVESSAAIGDEKVIDEKRDSTSVADPTSETNSNDETSELYIVYEASYPEDRIHFRGFYGHRSLGVHKNDQRAIDNLRKRLRSIVKKFPDDLGIIVHAVHVNFNPIGIKKAKPTRSNQGEKNQESTSSSKGSQYTPEQPRFKWGDAQLSADASEQLEEFLFEVENQAELRGSRLHNVFPSSAFLLALHGPAGTGKTTLASGIADRIGRPILELSYASIESSLVGEAAKNLKRVFEVAKETNALIFIDEADSLASHRPANFSQGADYHISSLRSELFTEITKFDGVIVVATNNAKTYDKAFVSRIYLSLEMPLPDETLRESLWQRYLPTEVSQNQLLSHSYLAKNSEGLAGRDIARIARRAAVQAHRRAGKAGPVLVEDVLPMIERTRKTKQEHQPSPSVPTITRIPEQNNQLDTPNSNHSSI